MLWSCFGAKCWLIPPPQSPQIDGEKATHTTQKLPWWKDSLKGERTNF